MEKKCKRCGEIKCLEYFPNDFRLKSGKSGTCKTCRKIIFKLSREKHMNRVIKNRKDYYSKNKAKENRMNKEYCKNNKDKIDKYRNEYRIANRKKAKEYSFERRRTMIEPRISNWKQNAKRRGIEWNLTTSYLKSLPMTCFYTGVELTLEPNKDNTLSLDRLNSELGYTIENSVFCCWWINEMKKDYNVESFLNFCERIYLNKERIYRLLNSGYL